MSLLGLKRRKGLVPPHPEADPGSDPALHGLPPGLSSLSLLTF